MSETVIDRSTAFFYEIHSQLEQYQPERFRRFYHDYIGDDLAPQDWAEELGVDFFRVQYFYTVSECELEVGFLGSPQDKLVSPTGELTSDAVRDLKRAGTFSLRMNSVSTTSEIPFLQPGFPIRASSVTIYSGRRALGAKTHEAFRSLAAEYLGIEKVKAHSFDSIVDQAMLIALAPFPFPNQLLLKDVLSNTNHAWLIKQALDRLDRISENGEIFERHLDNPATQVSAIPGTYSIEKLEALANSDDTWVAKTIKTRVAILKQDWAFLEKMATSQATYTAVHMAIEAIDEPAVLKRIRSQVTGVTPRDFVSRALVDMKISAYAGDLAEVEHALEELLKALPYRSDELSQGVLRVQAKLSAAQKKAPIVFLSYRHESEEHRTWVTRFAHDLRQNGIDALLDEWEINLGDSIADFAASAIFRAKAMLFLITEASVAAVESDEKNRSVVKFEFQIANARRYKDGNFRIIGILRSGERPPNHIADTLYVDFRHDQVYDHQLNRLINDLLGKSDKPGIGIPVSCP